MANPLRDPEVQIGFLVGLCLAIAFIQVGLPYIEVRESSQGSNLEKPRDKRDLPSRLDDYSPPTYGFHSTYTVGRDKYPVYRDRVEEKETVKPLLYTAILSDVNAHPDVRNAIEVTWGADSGKVDFYGGGIVRTQRNGKWRNRNVRYLGIETNEAFSDDHMLQVLKHLCRDVTVEYQWLLLTNERSYINSHDLRQVLEAITWSKRSIIGIPRADASEVCDTNAGLLFHHSAMRALCPAVQTCLEPDSRRKSHKAHHIGGSHDLGHCLYGKSRLRCFDSRKVWEGFHTDTTSFKPNESEQDALMITGVKSTKEIFGMHSYFLEKRVGVTKERLDLLGQQLLNQPNPVRSKRDSRDMLPVDQSFSLKFVDVLNSSKEYFHNFVDQNGKLYTDSCKVQTMDVHHYESSYTLARSLAETRIDPSQEYESSFAHIINRPNSGVDFQFYYLQGQGIDTPQYSAVHQVTIHQYYQELHIAKKEIEHIQRVHIFTEVLDISHLERFLDMIHQACEKGECFLSLLVSSQQVNDPDKYQTMNSCIEKFQQARGFQVNLYVKSDHVGFSFLQDLSQFLRPLSGEVLLASIPQGVLIKRDFLLRCRVHTGLHKSVYFPVPFQLYKHSLKMTDRGREISQESGYWDRDAFDTFCSHAADLENAIVAYNQSFPMADYTSDKLFYAYSGDVTVDTVRRPDPDLLTPWHKDECSHGTSKEQMECMKALRFVTA